MKSCGSARFFYQAIHYSPRGCICKRDLSSLSNQFWVNEPWWMSGTSQKSFTFKAQCSVEKRGRENLDFFFQWKSEGFHKFDHIFGFVLCYCNFNYRGMQLKSSFSSLKYSGLTILPHSNLSSRLYLKTVDWSRNAKHIVLTVLDQVTILDFQLGPG